MQITEVDSRRYRLLIDSSTKIQPLARLARVCLFIVQGSTDDEHPDVLKCWVSVQINHLRNLS